METKRLGYFVRIARDGSLTKASAMLRVAQSALSRQIRLLEEELGFALFDRTARGMQLTPEGEELLASVAGPLRELELAIQNSRSFSPRIEGNITFGLPPGFSEVLALPLALRMDAEFPNIHLRIIEGPTGGLTDWLTRGLIDIALLEEPSRNDRLSDHALLSEPLYLIGGTESELTVDAALSFAQAAALPLIIPSHHLGLRGVLNDAAASLPGSLNIRFEADSPHLIRQLVASGMGYSILPMFYAGAEIRSGALRHAQINRPVILLNAVICTRRALYDNPIVMNRIRDRIFEISQEILNGIQNEFADKAAGTR
jgi:DNA-binding transcriptional LysR family regulator